MDLLKYILKRILIALLTLPHRYGGDVFPDESDSGRSGLCPRRQQRRRVRLCAQKYGLDKPVIIQYLLYEESVSR